MGTPVEILAENLIHGASLLDLTPTILTLFGLPVGEDMDGEPLLDLFETPPEIATFASWEAIEQDAAAEAEAERLRRSRETPEEDDHAEVIADPHRSARRVALFLGDLGEWPMNVDARAAVVEPRLHRQHKGGLAALPVAPAGKLEGRRSWMERRSQAGVGARAISGANRWS